MRVIRMAMEVSSREINYYSVVGLTRWIMCGILFVPGETLYDDMAQHAIFFNYNKAPNLQSSMACHRLEYFSRSTADWGFFLFPGGIE